MKNTYFEIKDNCRKGLLKYMVQALIVVPELENPKILDIGCGTGVPTLWLAENLGGTITAIDTDKNALEWLQKKIMNTNLNKRISALNISFFDLRSDPDYFDIILAEGSLNVIGFRNGFLKVTGMLKHKGYFIIHDEYRDHQKKCGLISENHCELTNTLFLDEQVWWNDYYKQLEKEINSIKTSQIKSLFKSEQKEIELYKSDPAQFKSMYYIVKKF